MSDGGPQNPHARGIKTWTWGTLKPRDPKTWMYGTPNVGEGGTPKPTRQGHHNLDMGETQRPQNLDVWDPKCWGRGNPKTHTPGTPKAKDRGLRNSDMGDPKSQRPQKWANRDPWTSDMGDWRAETPCCGGGPQIPEPPDPKSDLQGPQDPLKWGDPKTQSLP